MIFEQETRPKMGTGFSLCGSSHLAKRSELVRQREKLEKFHDILVVEDDTLNSERLTATLRVIFGYAAQIRTASTLGDAVNAVIERKPGIIFLDDVLKPSSSASQGIPLLRNAGYAGPIIIVSGLVTHARRISLLAEGAIDVVHKDDVDSVRLAEALGRL